MVRRMGLYGGTFNPPHNGHLAAARQVVRALALDELLLMPAYLPPHKPMPPDSPDDRHRLAMTRLLARDIPKAEVSDLELRREGVSYTVDTLCALQAADVEWTLVVGGDMLRALPEWYCVSRLLSLCRIAAVARETSEDLTDAARTLEALGAREITIIDHVPVAVSSTSVRTMKDDMEPFVPPKVYQYILTYGLYGTREISAHVRGVADTARKLADRWGVCAELAEQAGLLHDVTKGWSLARHLKYCEECDIVPDKLQRTEGSLLHAVTGAAWARERFAASPEIARAIRRHTTAGAEMTTLDQIVYLADKIEPQRDYEGVDELRKLAFEDLNRAMLFALSQSIRLQITRGCSLHPQTVAARNAILTKEEKL